LSIIQERPVEVSMLFLLAVLFVIWLLFDPRNTRFRVLVHGVAVLLAICAMMKLWHFQGARKNLRRELAIAEYYRRRRIDGDLGEVEDTNKNDSDLATFLKEHRQEISGDGAHNLFGCARSHVRWFGGRCLRSSNNSNDENDHENESGGDRQGFCLNAWRCLSNAFCGMLCGCHLQLFGICATAQESRHLQEAIPTSTSPHFWQRDYITMQPWKEYYPSILRLRLLKQVDFLSHFKALSKLSHRILVAVVAGLIFVTTIFLLPIRFPKWQIFIFYGTLLQPLVFLFFVHWMWNRLDLSLDAVIKYFACGFFICTGCGIVYEWLVSKLAIEFIKLVDHFGSDALRLFADHNDPDGHHISQPFWYHLTIGLLQTFMNAFVVAGLTEEICKYLCFWMVEHPDLEVGNKIILSSSSERSMSEGETGPSDCEDTEVTRLLSRVAPSALLSSSDPEKQVIIAPRLPLACIGEAITVAMVTVALGFGCAENFLYIFVYTAPKLSAEIGTLYMRCLYPIHPMCAALQSIGVCRRYLEKDSSVGVGRILLPALMLHGFFDFTLMGYNYIRPILESHEHARDHNQSHTRENEPDMKTVDEYDSILRYAFIIPLFAMMYYMYESIRQKERLEELDKQNRTRSRSIAPQN